MDMTYEIGTKRKYSYTVKIPKRNYDKSENRHNLIISIVEQNPHIPHTHVIQLALKIGRIPKIVVENKLKELKKGEILIDKKEGKSTSNGLRTWSIFTTEDDWEKEAIEGIDMLLENESGFKKFLTKNTTYTFQTNLQTTHLINLFSELLSILYILPKGDKSKHVVNKTKKLQKMLDGIYSNISEGDKHNSLQIINILKKNCEMNLKQFLELSETYKK